MRAEKSLAVLPLPAVEAAKEDDFAGQLMLDVAPLLVGWGGGRASAEKGEKKACKAHGCSGFRSLFRRPRRI